MKTILLHCSGAEIANSITQREYNRLLQLPRDRELEGDLLDRAEKARSWYMKNGRPFVAARRVEIADISAEAIHVVVRTSRPPNAGASPTAGELDARTTTLRSLVLSQRLKAGEANALMIVAASAGPEVAQEAARHWKEERPDEGFFLDRFAVAVTEHLLFWASATLCRMSEPAHETLLPHLSPGCGHWDLNDQHHLMALLCERENGTTLGPIHMLSSGGLDPQHSVLAAMGVTQRNFGVTPESLCRACDMNPCKFRRAPYSGSPLYLLQITGARPALAADRDARAPKG